MRRSLSTILALSCSACDYTALSTAVGEHVVYHWDSSEEQLCGGTVAVADRLLEAIPAYYGGSLEDEGPNIEYFWGVPRGSGVCAWGVAHECAYRLATGFTVFSKTPIHTHELAHTARGGHGQPIFINEGFASRWESELFGTFVRSTSPSSASEEDLRAQLEFRNSKHVDYFMAHTWWVALETTYGPSKMGELIDALAGTGSAQDVESALQQVLGISLSESAALAASLPELFLDDPACELAGLPTMVWDGEPLVIDRGAAHCKDSDIVNFDDNRVTWLFMLEFPEDWVSVSFEVTVPNDMDRQQKALVLSRCDGEISLDYMPSDHFGASYPGDLIHDKYLSGRYVAALRGVLDGEGSVEFPRVVLEEASP